MLTRHALFAGTVFPFTALTFTALSFAALSFPSCSKSSNTGSGQGLSVAPPDTTTRLQGPTLLGHWTVFKYVAANFDTVGLTPLPNDTIYPTHDEFKIFTKDSVYEESWETFSYYFAHPDSFNNTQSRQFMDTAAYTEGTSYYIEPRFAPNDTVFLAALSDTVFVGMQKFYQGLGATGPVLYDLYIYARKD